MSRQEVGLLGELKRRNIFRVAAGFVVVAWLVLQVADVLLPAFGFGDAAVRVVFGVLVVAFPVVLLFSWLFEITPEGIKREAEVDRSESITPVTGRKLDRLIIAALSLALAFFVVDRFVWQASPPDEESTDRFIAVLPFADMSEDGDQAWFSDGISEELLNLLAGIPELRVLGRTSSFQFRGQNLDLRSVADTLGVSHLLDGSVRRVGDDLRITAALIDGEDGSELWSSRFDRSAGDIFAVQDEIARAVVQELRATLMGDALVRPTPASTAAHDLFLEGQYLASRRTVDDMMRAVDLLTRAIELDSAYAPAWGVRGSAYANLGVVGGLPSDSASALSSADLEQSRLLNPDDPLALSRQAWSYGIGEWRWAEALQAMERALRLAPRDPLVNGNAASLYTALGRVEQALELATVTTVLDPLFSLGHSGVAFAHYYLGHFPEAQAAWTRARELVPDDPFTSYRISNARMLKGDPEGAMDAVRPILDDPWGAAALPLIYHALGREAEADAALQRLIEEYAAINPVAVAEAYAFRGEVDEAFSWLDRAYEARASRVAYVMGNPLLASLFEDPRYTAFLERLGLPRE